MMVLATVWFASMVTVAVDAATGPLKATTYDFDDSDGLGRKFDGIGGLSGGGATSKLLVNYPEKERNEILDFLFKPNFGASLQILKVEIGGDAQTTDGTEASHMHYSWDENYKRGYEWWLMVEAKKRNPNIKLYGLPWAFPGWIGQGVQDPYQNPSVTADYVIRWINGAKVHYNLTIDLVGIWNERPYNITYIKSLRKMLDSRGFTSTRIVAADDNGWSIIADINQDSALSNAVDVIGCHYPGTLSTDDALKTGKQLWASEDYSTFNDEVGGGCWARLLNQNYAVGHMTASAPARFEACTDESETDPPAKRAVYVPSAKPPANGTASSWRTISWNLIASYYYGLPHFREGLMTAVEPWSGNYNVTTPIWITAHTTQFTEIGWMYLRHGSGVGLLEGGGSYVALVSPDGKDLTIIVETMSHDHSLCIRPPLPEYNVVPQTMNIQLKGAFAGIPQMSVWYSKLIFDGESSTMFQRKDAITFKNSMASLSLGVDEVYTLTTRTTGQKGQYPAPPPSKPFPLPYTDNFENYAISEEPYNLAQQTGLFEIVAGDSKHGQVARQMVLQTPVSWSPVDAVNKSVNVIGDYFWSDIYVEVEAAVGDVNGTDGVFIGARVQNGGKFTDLSEGLFFFVFPRTQRFIVSYNLACTSMMHGGSFTAEASGWNKLSLLVKGSTVQGSVNGNLVLDGTFPLITQTGFVAIGTDSYGIADFDNLRITSASDGLLIMRENQKP